MEKENIKTVTIEDFKNSQHILDYLDDDFAIVNSLDGIPYSNEIVRLECFLIAVCIEGCIQLDINNKTYQLQPGDLLLGLPNTIIGHTMMSPKYKIRLAGFSTRFLQRILKVEKDTWDTAIHIHNNPIKSISRENDNSTRKLPTQRKRFRKKASSRLTIFYGNSWNYCRKIMVCIVL